MDSAMLALQLGTHAQYQEGIGDAHSRLGTIYKYQGKYPEAVLEFEKAKTIRFKIGDSSGAMGMVENIGLVELLMNNLIPAKGKITEVMLYRWREKDDIGLTKSYQNYSNTLVELGSHDSALVYLGKALDLNKKLNNEYNIVGNTYNIASLLVEMSTTKNDSAIGLLKNCLVIQNTYDDTKGMADTYYTLGRAQYYKGEYDKALKSVRKAIQFGLDLDYRDVIKDSYRMQAQIYRAISRHDSAYLAMVKYDSIKIELLNDSTNVQVAIVQKEYKFQSEIEKEKSKAQAQRKKSMMTIIVLAGLLVTATLISLLFRNRMRAKTILAEKNKKLHQTEMENLKQQGRLDKMSSLMEGQEQERSRISKELHDNFGAMLSTIKIHLGLVGKDVKKNGEKLSKVHELIEDAHIDIRRISHEMASNVLGKFGLVAAIRDLADHYNSGDSIKVVLTITEEAKLTDKTIEIHLYRIVQEALNNSTKHSKASQITINLSIWPESIVLIIEDNGIGFSMEEARSKKSMGLENMQARVDLMNGQLNVDSTIGSGTTLVIEVPITGEHQSMKNG